MGPLQMAWFPMEEGATGATGSVVQTDGYVSSHGGTLVYIHVDDMEGALTKINENVGKTLMPKSSIDEYVFIAHFEDAEVNRVALHSES